MFSAEDEKMEYNNQTKPTIESAIVMPSLSTFHTTFTAVFCFSDIPSTA